MLRIQNLRKVFPGGVIAVDDLSLTVPDGEFLVIIGLSGSGKSTLLRCINRLVEPTVRPDLAGRCRADGALRRPSCARRASGSG